MTDSSDRPQGLALRCDRAGTVVEVMLDTLDSGLDEGRAFTEVVGTASIPDALTLLSGAHRGLLLRPVLLELDANGGAAWLHVVACGEDDGRVVVAGAASIDGLSSVIDAATSSMPGVWGTLQQLMSPGRAEVADEDVLDAMSATNNELAGMHRELARTNAELDQFNRRKDEILAMVAHDLRNPLGAVTGFATAIERQLDGVLDTSSRQMLTRIEALGSRMLALVDDLLDTAVIQNDTLRLEFVSTDLHRLLSDTVENHRHAAELKGVDLHLDLDQPTVMASVDGNRLVQVIDNLLSNAIKFSPAGVGARVTVGCTTPDADHVAIIVRDQGVGLSDEDRERLFKPFAQRSRTGTANERGTGLGLGITRSIVDAHNGHINVNSEVGTGSTFTLTLPSHPSHPT